MKQLIVFSAFILICCIKIPASANADAIELTTTLIQGSEPLFMMNDRNGSRGAIGICPEIMNAFTRIAPEFTFIFDAELVPWPRVKGYLKDNTIQAQFCIARTAERETWYQYTDTPLYPVRFSFAVRKDDTQVRNINSFEEMKRSGGTVLCVIETNAAEVFRERTKHLNIPIEETPTNEQNLKKLILGRGRYVLFHHYALIDGAKKLGISDKIILIPLVLKETHHWLAFSKAVPQDVLQKANVVLRELQESGKLKSIYDKYGRLP